MVDGATVCTLCELPTRHPLLDEQDRPYCCPACLEVSQLLAHTEVSPTPPAPHKSQMEHVTLRLGGLWCPSCAWLIRTSLEKSAGVASAEVSFLQREVLIRYDAARVKLAALQRRIKRTGYQAWLPGAEPPDEEEGFWMRLLISGVFAMHVMVLSLMLYVREWTGRATPETEWLADFFGIMILVTAVPVMVLLGLPILRAGIAGLARGRPNTHTLIALGAFAAFGLSIFHVVSGSGGIYFDTAAILLFLVAIGRWLEMRAQKNSMQAVSQLWDRLPGSATRLTARGPEKVSLTELVPGTRVLVVPGERFPADGIVATGCGDVDESLLTGESRPLLREPGSRVLAGATNLDGAFEILATAVGADTVVAQIGRMLHQALWQRAPVERQADRLASWLVPLASLLALATFAFWTWFSGLEAGLINALSVLLIACPCALGIATPLTLWSGLGRAAERGIILRQTGVLEALADVRELFFDKTGTLTRRPIRLHSVVVDSHDSAEFMRLTAAAEVRSEHPLGQAIYAGLCEQLKSCTAAGGLPKPAAWRALPGEGVVAQITERRVCVGSLRLMSRHGLELSERLEAVASDWQSRGYTLVYAGWNGLVKGILVLGEQVRPELPAALSMLSELGLQSAVLTGDDAGSATLWEQRFGIPVFAGLRPEEKIVHIRRGSRATLMVGDGINDAPALAAARVGIAVAGGSEVAKTSADVVLLQEDLRQVPWLLMLSRLTMTKVRQNLGWAVAYNVIGLALAITGQLQPAVAALFMVASNLFVTGNALRLRRAEIFSSEADLTAAGEPALSL